MIESRSSFMFDDADVNWYFLFGHDIDRQICSFVNIPKLEIFTLEHKILFCLIL